MFMGPFLAVQRGRKESTNVKQQYKTNDEGYSCAARLSMPFISSFNLQINMGQHVFNMQKGSLCINMDVDVVIPPPS